MTEEKNYSDQLSYAMGDEAEASQEQPEETQETETPSETPDETQEETQEPSETNEETKETEEQPQEEEAEETKESEEEPQAKEEEEHLTRSQKRKLYIQRLEEENKKFKEAQLKNLPWNKEEEGEIKELTPEELDQMVEKKVQSIREAEKHEQTRQEWANDYQDTIKKYPELNPESKSYNQELDQLLTDLLTDGDGNPKLTIKVSQAYERMKNSLETAKTQGAENASLKLAKQKEESAIAPSATGEETKTETWEDLHKLQQTDPEAYYERIRKGNLPAE